MILFRVFLLAVVCLPATGAAARETAAEALARSLAIAGTQQAVQVLANAIQTSRDQALAEGVAPIPAEIRRQLSGHVPDADLDSVRWRVRGGSDLSLQRTALDHGGATAITLIDIVVFADKGDALANAALWAHELRHVTQYREWGLTEFSRRYLADHTAVEADAAGFAAKWSGPLSRARKAPQRRPWTPQTNAP